MSSERKLPKYQDVDGFRLPGGFHAQSFSDFLKYEPQADDIFLVTYPKCGTNWMHYIIYLIYHDGEPPRSGMEFFKSCPFPEAFGLEGIANMTRPGVIKTHLPYHLQPKRPENKFIIVVRNPKDCCVSFYHHTENTDAIYEFAGGQFDDYFELFMEGQVDYGDYYDHILGWYEHRKNPNILMLTYEKLKQDTARVIVQVARFLGEEYGKRLESDENLLQKITENCNVKNMESIANNFVFDLKDQDVPEEQSLATKHVLGQFEKLKESGGTGFRMVRKGIIGDWRNTMSKEQIQRIDEKTQQIMGDTELYAFWKSINAI